MPELQKRMLSGTLRDLLTQANTECGELGGFAIAFIYCTGTGVYIAPNPLVTEAANKVFDEVLLPAAIEWWRKVCTLDERKPS